MAPAKRAMPETRFWLVSSLTALVKAMPGISTISDEMITVLRFSGPIQLATTTAIIPANIAAIASLASLSRGRSRVAQSSTPSSRPVTPAVAISSHGSRHSPATAAADSPNARIEMVLPRQRPGRSSARSAAWPASRSSVPAITASATRSTSHNLYRSVSPGDSLTTRTVSRRPRPASPNDRIMPVGLDHAPHSSPRVVATAITAPSSRCAVVP